MSRIFNNFGIDSIVKKQNHHFQDVSLTGEKLKVQRTDQQLMTENFFNEQIPNINQVDNLINLFVEKGYSLKTARATVLTLKQGAQETQKDLTETYSIVDNKIVLTQLGNEVINAIRNKNVQIVSSNSTPESVSKLIKG